MKRFVPEISLGLATAMAIAEVCSCLQGQPASAGRLVAMGLGVGVCWGALKRREVRAAIAACLREQRASEEHLRRLVADGQPIAAVKLHRERHGSTLREAADEIRAMQRVGIGH